VSDEETPQPSRLRDTIARLVDRDGFRHYKPVSVDVELGLSELVRDAEVAQRLLDLANVPDGHPQSGGDIDTRVAALVLRATDAEARLATIAGVHARETAPGGMVGDYCVECDHRWPCRTYMSATSPETGV
jgi:hypothetical protein